ncbi:MAG TPA: VWA domain-containing protein [Terracidiphilus sp.]|nr:VWA domain-containing protein [Terracidiphilus sp.]
MHVVKLAVALFVSGLAIAVQAQSAAPTASSGPQSSDKIQQETIFKTTSYSVLVDVVVTNESVAVHGIDPRQFHIYENGREQPISFFDEHKPESGAGPTAQRHALPPHYYDNVPNHAPGSAVNILLLDGLNTPVADQGYVRKQMIAYVKTITPGTTLAIFTLASRLRMVQGFTSNIDDLVKALDSTKTQPQKSVGLDTSAGDAFDSAIGNLTMVRAPADTIALIQGFQSDVGAIQTDRRVQITLEAMQQLARYLSAVPGRKNLIWFSGSFPIALGPDPGNQSLQNVRSYAEQVRATSDLLSAARVAVYPVDARGMMTLPGFDSANNGLNSPNRGGGFANINSRAMSADTNSHFSMEQIARDTGGKAFFNTNGFRAAIASAIQNGESYYTIGYVPESKKFDGDFRKIKVKLDNSKYDLEYRPGYYADPPDKPGSLLFNQASLMTAATLHGGPLSTQVLFQTRILPATDPEFKEVNFPAGPAGELSASLKGPAHRYIVDLVVDPHTVIFDSSGDGTRTGSIEFTLVAYDPDGKRLNLMDRATKFSLNSSQYAQLMKTGIPVRMALDLSAEEQSLRIAVHDILGVRVGSLEIPLTVSGN